MKVKSSPATNPPYHDAVELCRLILSLRAAGGYLWISISYAIRVLWRMVSRRQLWHRAPPYGRDGLLLDLESFAVLTGIPPRGRPHDVHLPVATARLE